MRVLHKDILWLKAEGNYTRVITRGSSFRVRAYLQDFSTQLGCPELIRVHNSYVVNMAAIDELHKKSLRIGEQRIPITNGFRSAVFEQCLLF